jgi:hypothetical protein
MTVSDEGGDLLGSAGEFRVGTARPSRFTKAGILPMTDQRLNSRTVFARVCVRRSIRKGDVDVVQNRFSVADANSNRGKLSDVNP